jgi:hypothetical protein
MIGALAPKQDHSAMAAKAKKDDEPPKRLNRVVGAGEALGRALDPVFRKRGFASRDLIAHWAAMAPAPYDKVAQPDKLTWPRGVRTAEGATLHLRVAPGHALALAHEGERIAAAINRYFGYLLIGAVRQSAMPFARAETAPVPAEPEASEATKSAVGEAVAHVSDQGLRDALTRLGRRITRNS